jgi:cytochrome c oxidase subunit 2
MVLQNQVWLVTLAGIGFVALGFIYAVARSRIPADAEEVHHRAYAVRRWWFLALLLGGIGATWASLEQFPVPDQRNDAKSAQVVQAVGRQWLWQLDHDRFVAGVPVEFHVTSQDVNHGFAIYDPEGHVVTQTQAMPGYTNRLLHTFTQPGKYRVLCLEYCGLAHHGMMTEFEVVAPDRGGRP